MVAVDPFSAVTSFDTKQKTAGGISNAHWTEVARPCSVDASGDAWVDFPDDGGDDKEQVRVIVWSIFTQTAALLLTDGGRACLFSTLQRRE